MGIKNLELGINQIKKSPTKFSSEIFFFQNNSLYEILYSKSLIRESRRTLLKVSFRRSNSYHHIFIRFYKLAECFLNFILPKTRHESSS